MKEYLWTTYSARKLLAKLKPLLENVNWTCALGGSVASHGHSDNDLDLVVFPFNTGAWPDKDDIWSVLQEVGMKRVLSAEDVREGWKKRGSTDTKHVEIWTYQGRRIDVIVLNG